MCTTVNNEEWRFVRGFEGLYQVSNWGRVRSFSRIVTKSNGNTYFAKGQTLRLLPNKSGFQVTLYKDNPDGTKTVQKSLVHRLVMDAFGDGLEVKKYVLHADGNKTNNRADNLYYSDIKVTGTKDTEQTATKPKKKIITFYTADGKPLGYISKIHSISWGKPNDPDREGYDKRQTDQQ